MNSEDDECKEIGAGALMPVNFYDRDRAIGCVPESELMKSLPPGEHNRSNAMAAAAVACLLGFSEDEVFATFPLLTLPEGRMQLIEQYKRRVFIDYAHTPDALQAVLHAARSLHPRVLITVFGCGGDRDRSKRSLMGEMAESLSDVVIVTSDNPRSENPFSIAEDILQGTAEPDEIIVEIDRAHAIQRAIALSEPNDIVVIAGKGHETTQSVAGQTIPFSDFNETISALQQVRSVR